MCKFQSSNLSKQPFSFPPITYRDVPVLTTDMLARAYEVEPHQIRQNFKNNRERFIEGKHLFSLSGSNLKEFKNCVENFYSVQIGKRTATILLWTERGAARHAKMLNSDRAWDVFELLEETFFAVAKPRPADLAPFPPVRTLPLACRDQLNALVLAKLAYVPPVFVWKTRMSIWAAFNRRFGIPQYRLLPEERMAEAVAFLSGLETGPRGTVNCKSAQIAMPLDDARQTISALSSLIDRAQSILAALPAKGEVHHV